MRKELAAAWGGGQQCQTERLARALGGDLQAGRGHRQGGRQASERSCLGSMGLGPRVKLNQKDVLEVRCPGVRKSSWMRLEIKPGPGTLLRCPMRSHSATDPRAPPGTHIFSLSSTLSQTVISRVTLGFSKNSKNRVKYYF